MINYWTLLYDDLKYINPTTLEIKVENFIHLKI
jgi:hypothetical protein